MKYLSMRCLASKIILTLHKLVTEKELIVNTSTGSRKIVTEVCRSRPQSRAQMGGG